MASAAEGPQAELCRSLWAALGECISPEECSVYSYIPSDSMDPLCDEDTIWSFNYFFYNKRLKRIAYFVCSNAYDSDDGMVRR